MSEIADRFADELEQLRRIRDEVKVQAHLGRAEVKERWEKLERDWSHVEGKLQVLREAGREDLKEVAEAGRQLMQEIARGYKHLKSLL